MSMKSRIALIFAAGLAILAMMSIFIVDEREKALVLKIEFFHSRHLLLRLLLRTIVGSKWMRSFCTGLLI